MNTKIYSYHKILKFYIKWAIKVKIKVFHLVIIKLNKVKYLNLITIRRMEKFIILIKNKRVLVTDLQTFQVQANLLMLKHKK